MVKFGDMKLVLFSFLLFYSLSSTCQGVIPVKNFNNFFMSFNNGFFNQIEVQAINGYKAGDVIAVTVNFSESVTVIGVPQLINRLSVRCVLCARNDNPRL